MYRLTKKILSGNAIKNKRKANANANKTKNTDYNSADSNVIKQSKLMLMMHESR